ncbi:MAG: DUF3990 domain-containing protein [Bacilli bacterium]|nr:DUF3990 domain-containing protein [Bacilli bacterium]
MKVYYGSKTVVSHPTHNGSKKENDYGPAFYLTRDLVSAHEWACRNGTIGFVNEYELNTHGLKILNLTDKNKYSILNWLAILLHFRILDKSFISSFSSRLKLIEENYYIDVLEYDLVIGYRADDAYFRFPLDFIRGNLTIEQLERSFMLGNLGVQYAIISQKGIDHLTYIKSFSSDEKYINQYFSNVLKASKAFDSLNKDEEGIRIFDILKEIK